jgi:transcriptional regulator with XRE-family HTH domain
MEELELQINDFIGIKLKEKRTQLAISQQQIANHINVSVEQIEGYESKAEGMLASKLKLISQFLDVDSCYFYGESSLTVGEWNLIQEYRLQKQRWESKK